MKSPTILLARVLAFVETADLNPKGKVFYPDLVRESVERYQFQVFPKTPEQYDEQKGVEFQSGKAGNRVIESLRIFNTVLVVETRSNTTDSKEIIEEVLEWGKQKFGLNYEPGMIKRWAYVSDVTFHSDVPLLGTPNSPIGKLASKTTDAISQIWGEKINYHPTAFSVGHDPSIRKNSIAQFTLSRRIEIPFSENKYFSEAPLPTDMHIKFLEEFEADVRGMV
jgi:hypothetical protein